MTTNTSGRFSLAVVAVALSAQTVLAAGDGGHGSGSPSLFAGDLGNLIWTLVIFVLVLVVLGKFAWGPILKVLQTREEFIRDSLTKAKEEREESHRALADYMAQIEKAKDEATAIVDEGRRDAEEMRKRIQAEAKAEAQAIAERAKRDIGLARDHAVKQLHDEVIVLAASVAGKMIRREVNAEEHKSLLDESLAELGRMNN